MTREEAIDIIKCLAWHTRPDEEMIEQAIKALEQEPKTGHWIFAGEENEEEARNGNFRYICSECGYSDVHAKSTEVRIVGIVGQRWKVRDKE